MRERRRYRGEGEEKEGEEEGEEAKEEARMKERETQSGLAPPSLFSGDPSCGRRGSIASVVSESKNCGVHLYKKTQKPTSANTT